MFVNILKKCSNCYFIASEMPGYKIRQLKVKPAQSSSKPQCTLFSEKMDSSAEPVPHMTTPSRERPFEEMYSSAVPAPSMERLRTEMEHEEMDTTTVPPSRDMTQEEIYSTTEPLSVSRHSRDTNPEEIDSTTVYPSMARINRDKTQEEGVLTTLLPTLLASLSTDKGHEERNSTTALPTLLEKHSTDMGQEEIDSTTAPFYYVEIPGADSLLSKELDLPCMMSSPSTSNLSNTTRNLPPKIKNLIPDYYRDFLSKQALETRICNSHSEERDYRMTIESNDTSDDVIVSSLKDAPPNVDNLNEQGIKAWQEIEPTVLHVLCDWFSFENNFLLSRYEREGFPFEVKAQKYREKFPDHEIQWLLKCHRDYGFTLDSVRRAYDSQPLLRQYASMKWPTLTVSDILHRVRGMLLKYKTRFNEDF